MILDWRSKNSSLVILILLFEKLISFSLIKGIKWRWAWGTSNPTTDTPTLTQSTVFDNDDEIFLEKIKISDSIIIEDLEESFDEKLLYSIFNLVEQDNKYLLISSKKPIDTMKFTLPDLLSRLKNCIIATIEQPDDELIYAIILKSFSDRQIKLDNKIIDYIIKRIARSYSKMHEFIYKIDELSLKKKKSINFKIIKEIINWVNIGHTLAEN